MTKKKILLSMSIIFVISLLYFILYNNNNNNTVIEANDILEDSLTNTEEDKNDIISSRNLYLSQQYDTNITLEKLDVIGNSTIIELWQYLEGVGLNFQFYFYNDVLIDSGSSLTNTNINITSYDNIYAIENEDISNDVIHSRLSVYDLDSSEKIFEIDSATYESTYNFSPVVGIGNNFISFENDTFIDLNNPEKVQSARQFFKTELNDNEMFDYYMSLDDENGFIEYSFIGRDDENNLIYECRNVFDDTLIDEPVKIKLSNAY